jgi:hypothetical protein
MTQVNHENIQVIRFSAEIGTANLTNVNLGL